MIIGEHERKDFYSYLKTYFCVGMWSLFVTVTCSLLSCDRTPKLSTKDETIVVTYINWACNCADFVETKFLPNNSSSVKDSDCIFLEPTDSTVAIPDSFKSKLSFDYYLELQGSFYEEKWVPESYEKKIEELPVEAARVFRYRSFKLIAKNPELTEAVSLEGNWVSNSDPLSTVLVKNKKWYFEYDGAQEETIYSVQILDSLPQYASVPSPAGFLRLTSEGDTLEYELLTLNDSVLSMMYFPRGNILTYHKKAE